MDEDFREVTAFDVVNDLFADFCAIEFYENPNLPTVLNPYNPYSFSIEYKDKVWYCDAKFTCMEDKDQYVHIHKEFPNDQVFALLEIYDNREAPEN